MNNKFLDTLKKIKRGLGTVARTAAWPIIAIPYGIFFSLAWGKKPCRPTPQDKFVTAASKGRLLSVKMRLKKVDINESGKYRPPNKKNDLMKISATALEAAAAHGQEKIVDYLLKSGADPNSYKGQPLFMAVHFNHAAIEKKLLAHGAHAKNLPMDQAVVYDCPPETFDHLIKLGADINKQRYDGWTALHQAVWQDDEKMVSFLLEKGANPALKDQRGETPLETAQKNNRPKMARLLTIRSNKSNPPDSPSLN